ncbi:Os03g0412200 [Oryza sativa Japonica Group]|uniref:Expressed protein n=3 Tax=Oryza TaxID=4527 RepID=Q852F0_ORYSJ|nr:expressed protein [Oryza sativa Japonica Group]ABF96577.1 expressed protein [Oryza sativa Japonica Group]KAB8092183.1 hypothetical protein EE612_018077 [Oryza sativa]BAG90918.1 unnamed protein product [Oryza sativa Japonica Group]BAS84671.1 Os03g0412200 [Oryza sativa Japonica Group]
MFLHVRNVTDNDGFVIPSLSVEESDLGDWEAAQVSRPQPPPKATKDTEKIYLGPHGAPPSRAKKQEDTAAAATGYRDKSKVKEADQKVLGTGRDNKGGNNFNRYNNAGHHVKEPYKRST